MTKEDFKEFITGLGGYILGAMSAAVGLMIVCRENENLQKKYDKSTIFNGYHYRVTTNIPNAQ
jgi:hypothetical protein